MKGIQRLSEPLYMSRVARGQALTLPDLSPGILLPNLGRGFCWWPFPLEPKSSSSFRALRPCPAPVPKGSSQQPAGRGSHDQPPGASPDHPPPGCLPGHLPSLSLCLPRPTSRASPGTLLPLPPQAPHVYPPPPVGPQAAGNQHTSEG